MPIFEYKCNDCGLVMEFLESLGKPQKHQCSKCGSINMNKMLSGFAVQTKSSHSCDSCPGPSQAECGGMCGGHCGLLVIVSIVLKILFILEFQILN